MPFRQTKRRSNFKNNIDVRNALYALRIFCFYLEARLSDRSMKVTLNHSLILARCSDSILISCGATSLDVSPVFCSLKVPLKICALKCFCFRLGILFNLICTGNNFVTGFASKYWPVNLLNPEITISSSSSLALSSSPTSLSYLFVTVDLRSRLHYTG